MGGISKDRAKNTSDVWSGQSDYLQGLFGAGNDLMQNFQPQTQVPGQAMQAWGQQLNPQMNPYMDQMAAKYGQQLGQANMATGGQAGLAGQRGGGRQGVAEHLNTQQYANNMGQFMGQQYQGDMNRASQALGMTGSMMGLDPNQQQWGNLQQYGNLLGSPTVLGQGSSSGSKFNVLGK